MTPATSALTERSETIRSESVRSELVRASRFLAGAGLPSPPVRGKLLRPAVSYAFAPAPDRQRLSRRFWDGALAIQMVHEASLLHDDILDGAETRRGVPTEVARKGLAAALVGGDHLLTAAYRVALCSDSVPFNRDFVTAVERTVAGELAQGRNRGRALAMDAYLEILDGKSGALFGVAASLPAHILEHADPARCYAVGVKVGRLYQMVDDLLDYCPETERGKPPFQDFGQRKWTLPLMGLDTGIFDKDPEELPVLLASPDPVTGRSRLRRSLACLESLADEIVTARRELVPGDPLLDRIVESWIRRARASVGREEEAVAGAIPGARSDVIGRARALGGPGEWTAYFARHGTTFRFASRLFPRNFARSVAGVYAFCRFTDDLVDEASADDPEVLRARLKEWRALARAAYHGSETGVELLDRVMGQARARGVPLRLVEELVAGVAMDVEPVSYGSLEELWRYSYRVASVVGEWICHLLGCHDQAVLDRAASLGQGMQLTNILRDVGEDLSRDRIYLPGDRMEAHGVCAEALKRAARGSAPLPRGYRALMEELIHTAESRYDDAMEGIPALPDFARVPVAVAAEAYRGIHGEIRRNDYDNLRCRAYTSLPRKVWLALRGAWKLLAIQRRNHRRAAAGGLRGLDSLPLTLTSEEGAA